ncbi:MAG: DUF1616 domain-containing protein [Candidatus Bathyarchaeota archaeon]|nr:DUF1616 domain-containing protein [Candidatus Bathyarchaeota archaeon]
MEKVSGNLNGKSSQSVFVVSVAIAIVLASVLLGTYYVALRPAGSEYATIYLLDSHQRGTDYPEFLVADVNSTFSVYVVVENHMGYTLNGTQVQVKAVNSNSVNLEFPLDVNATQTFEGTVDEGKTWESIATVTLNQPGNYLVGFELWLPDGATGERAFSGEVCVLNIEVATGTP